MADDLAVLALPEDPAGPGIQAICAIGAVHHVTGSPAGLRVASRAPETA